MVTAPRTVLCAPRRRRPRKIAPPWSGRRARAPSQSSLMTATWTAPPRTTAAPARRPVRRAPSADHAERRGAYAEGEGAAAHQLVAVAEEPDRPIARDAGLARAHDGEVVGTTTRQARQRREQPQARGGGHEAQLEDTVVVARGGGEREPAPERALVRDQERGARALERVRAPVRVAVGEADAVARRPEENGARGGERVDARPERADRPAQAHAPSEAVRRQPRVRREAEPARGDERRAVHLEHVEAADTPLHHAVRGPVSSCSRW